MTVKLGKAHLSFGQVHASWAAILEVQITSIQNMRWRISV
jgi:hypothetical protein